MKNFKNYLACLAVCGLFFTSCSKDENEPGLTDETVSLTFGAILNDLANTNKQTDIEDLPECSGDEPAYVEVVLMQGTDTIVGEDEPFRIDLVEGQVFTEDVPELELTPGTYSLTYFSVHDAEGDLLWLAPRNGGLLSEFVEDALPLSIELGAGVKKYVDVPVLCYDDRDVNEYGYLFFEFDTTEAFEFCFFVNYCPPNGKHFPARYSVEISIDGNQIYSEINTVGINEDGDPFAEALCFALPDLPQFEDDEEYIDYTITLLDWEGVYDAEPMAPITGSLSRDEITANFSGDNEVNYEHFRFGCGDTPPPGDDDDDDDGTPNDDDKCPGHDDRIDHDNDGVPDGCDLCPGHDDSMDQDEDGIIDGCDPCPEVATEDDPDGDCLPTGEDPCPNNPANDCDGEEPDGDVVEKCETAFMKGNRTFMNDDGDDLNLGNNWGWAQWVVVDVEDGLFSSQIWAGAGQNDTDKGFYIGDVDVTVDGEDVQITIDEFEGNSINLVHIYFSDTKPESNAPGQYGNTFDPDDDGLSYEFTDSNGDGRFWLIVHMEVCPADQD